MTTEYPPTFGGGIGTYCKHTVEMFKRHRDKVVLFFSDPSLSEDVVVEEDSDIAIVRFKPAKADYYKYMGYSAALSYEFADLLDRFVDRFGIPDVIECQEYAAIGYALLQRKWALHKKFSDVPIFATIHTPKFLCDKTNQVPIYKFPDFWIGEMERFVLKAADGVISPSKYMLDAVMSYTDVAKPSFVVPNPFEIDDFKIEEVKSENIDLLFVGRTEYRKGILQCLGYLSKMWDDGFSIPLHIVGGDTLFYPKQQMMKEYIADRFKKYIEKGLIVFEGKMPPNKLYSMLANAKVMLLPSLIENFPTVVLEAMWFEKIVLASDSGGQAEIIDDGKNGYLFSHSDENSFSSKLLHILSLKDSDLLEIGKKAKEKVENMCGYEAVYAKKAEAIEEIRKNSKGVKNFYPFVRLNSSNSESRYEIENDLLSIIIPYFNMGEYIEETVESIVNADYPNKEIIVVNDGSDDLFSIETLYKIEDKYPVKVIHKENGGLATARNFGAYNAKGEFIAFVDADDIVDKSYYSRAVNILRKYTNVSFVGCWAYYFGDNQETIWPTWNPEPPYLLVHNTMISGGLVYKRRDFLKYGLNDPEMEYGMEDYESVVRMIRQGCGGVVIPEALYKYRIRSDSMARQFNVNKVLYLYELLSSKNAEIYNKYGVEVFNIVNANGPGLLYDNPTWNFPQVGFVKEKVDADFNISADEDVPYEIKQLFKKMWNSKAFRKIIKIGLKTGVFKVFV